MENTNLPPFWRETYTIRTRDLDGTGRLSMVALSAMLLDAAGIHAHELGLAVTDLMGNKNTWVLSRFGVNILSQPQPRETITITTWPSGIERLSALRDFDITGPDGVQVGYASSSWLVINLETRRPVRVEPFLKKISSELAFQPGRGSLSKIPDLPAPVQEYRFPVRWSDIDFNRHVTSTSYIGWALESVPQKLREKRIITGFDINFRAETFFGETIISQSQFADGAGDIILHRITSEQDGRELARARSVWRGG
ncbi:acyl-[acyl-carrier-protein] thioesterase [Candidatus Latescibacterota bacterium]